MDYLINKNKYKDILINWIIHKMKQIVYFEYFFIK